MSADSIGDYEECTIANEVDFRLKFNANAMAVEKLAEGIRAFVVDQEKLEALLTTKLAV